MHDHHAYQFATDWIHAGKPYAAGDDVPDLGQLALAKLTQRGAIALRQPPQETPRQPKRRKPNR